MKKYIVFIAVLMTLNIVTSCNNSKSKTNKSETVVKVSESTGGWEKIGQVYEYQSKYGSSGFKMDGFGYPRVYVKVIGGKTYYKLSNGAPVALNPEYGKGGPFGEYKYMGCLHLEYPEKSEMFYFNF